MLICSVCRSQNLDSAKFCGNCGNPFPRSSGTAAPAAASSTSSLINCSQGHIYSAVYQSCPYCPQSGDLVTDFATRIDDERPSPITAVDPPAYQANLRSLPTSNDFITRVSPEETLFEPMEPTANERSLITSQTPILAPTEVISLATALDTNAEPFPVGESLPPMPSSPPFREEETTSIEQAFEAPQPPEPPRVTPMSSTPVDPMDGDRRTIVVTEPGQPVRGSKGRIVGWLITYSHDPDGEDFRIFAGYNRMGANPVCDIVVQDETVSGSHAIIVYRDGRCLIKDDLSRNGTFVNGREISESYPLQSYDQIRIGNTYLTFIAAQRIA
ncbi:MAG: FHA domain-containing protein [Blastocatellia bacterium]|nr:FHA domain-containing protein [Blastocatellia bacterium]